MQCSLRLCSRTAAVYFYTTPLNSLIHNHKLDHHLCTDDTQVYISLSTADTDISLRQLDDCLSDIFDRMANNRLRLNANKTYFIIIGTSRQSCKPTRFFPVNIVSHSITPPDAVRNLGIIFDNDFNFRKHISLTCRRCFYYIFVTFTVFVAIFLFQSPKPLLQHSLPVGLFTATLFFIASHLRI